MSKCEIKKKIVTNISFFFWSVWLLIIYVAAFLEFKQELKDFLDLKIYRAFIKLLGQMKRKTKKI